MGFPVDINNQQSVELIPKEKIIKKLFHVGELFYEIDTNGYSLCTYTISNFLTSSYSVIVQAGNNGINYIDVQPVALGSMASNLSATSGTFFLMSNSSTSYQLGKFGRFLKFSFNGVTSNSTLITILLSNGSVAANNKDIRIPNNNSWTFTSGATGITGTASNVITPGSISPALTYVINSLDITNSGAVDTVIQLRSIVSGGTSPIVRWSQYLKAGERISLQNITPGIASGGGGRIYDVISSENTTYFINVQGITTNN
jgi:hypothetical protein